MSVTITTGYAHKSQNPILILTGMVGAAKKSVVVNRDTFSLVMAALADPASAKEFVDKSAHYKGGAPAIVPPTPEPPKVQAPTIPMPVRPVIEAPKPPTVQPPVRAAEPAAPSGKPSHDSKGRPIVGQCVVKRTCKATKSDATYHDVDGLWWHYAKGGTDGIYAYRKAQITQQVIESLWASQQAPTAIKPPVRQSEPTGPTVLDASSGLKGYYLHMSDGTVRTVDQAAYAAACEELMAGVA